MVVLDRSMKRWLRSSGRSGSIRPWYEVGYAPQVGVVALDRSMKRWNTLLRSEW